MICYQKKCIGEHTPITLKMCYEDREKERRGKKKNSFGSPNMILDIQLHAFIHALEHTQTHKTRTVSVIESGRLDSVKNKEEEYRMMFECDIGAQTRASIV